MFWGHYCCFLFIAINYKIVYSYFWDFIRIIKLLFCLIRIIKLLGCQHKTHFSCHSYLLFFMDYLFQFKTFLSLDLQIEISEISIMSFQNVHNTISDCSRLHNSHNLRILYIDHFYRAANYHTQPRLQRDVHILFFI